MADRATYDFAAFPRGELVMRLDRREVLRSLATQLRVSQGTSRGGVAMRLADLGAIPDDQLATVRPLARSDYSFEDDGDFTWGVTRARGTRGKRLKLFPVDPVTSYVLHAFDGTLDLGAIAQRLSSELGWGTGHALAYVRGVFLHLVTLGVCVPA